MNMGKKNTLVAFHNQNGSMEVSLKRRMCGSPIATAQPTERQPFRIHFSITEKSRSWMRASHRSIRWVFGLAHPLQQGFHIEEQQVILTWNKKTGRIKRIHWNKHDIRLRFREHGLMAGTWECSWHTRTGELVQILIHKDEVRSERDRYTLVVDGESFTSFPTLRELERQRHETFQEHLRPLAEPRNTSSTSSTPLTDLSANEGYRLSLVGFSNKFEFSCGKQVKDELHSNLYSPLLDALRQDITRALPQAEQIVSEAITHAFCTDSASSLDSLSLSSNGFAESPTALEADVLKSADDWSQLYGTTSNEDEKLQFLQTLIDELVMHFRNEYLDSSETSRIVLEAAVVLGLELVDQTPGDTILWRVSGTTEDDLWHQFPEAIAVGCATTVAVVRFRSPAAAQRAADDDDRCRILLTTTPYIKTYGSGSSVDSTEQMSEDFSSS